MDIYGYLYYNECVKFLIQATNELMAGKFGLDMLIITKSLRGYYKNPDSIVQKVLADRMGERDPGNKPQSSDRIPFVYIQIPENKNRKILQGERVEHPKFIQENNLKPDYLFYITNQIKKPVSQIFELALEQLDNYFRKPNYYKLKWKELEKSGLTDAEILKKITELRLKDVDSLVFEKIIKKATSQKDQIQARMSGIPQITNWFKPKKSNK